MGQLFPTTKSRFQRSRYLHFVRLSRKPSNLCALLRSHEAMIDCVLINCVGDEFQKTRLLCRSAYGPGPLIYVCWARVIDALISLVALLTVQ